MGLSFSFFKSNWLVFALPLLVILSSVLIIQSGLFWQDPQALAIGVTYDLALTSPLLYLFLIRNKPIPKTTAIPFFIGGLLIASLLLPDDFQFHLDLLKTFLLPAVELGVIISLLIQTRKTIRKFREAPHTQDFLSNLRYAAQHASGSTLLGNVLASEVSLLYYGLISWKRTTATGSTIFSYHKKSGVPALYAAVILLLIVETIALHFIVGLWSSLAAWVLTLSSLYAVLQIFGHLKACLQRPIILTEDTLLIRYGLLGDAEIPLSNIATVTPVKNFSYEKATQLALLKGLEPYNVAIELTEPTSLTGLYGIRTNFKTLLLFIDQKDAFLRAINKPTNNL